MFLKRIELYGFKSFADKTVLQFDSPLTGVVGPNGCGKSNITDAIRWVLGEQSAKSLRSGSSISDIIFSGSQSRKAVNTARATLVFDNTGRIFDTPYDEIEVTRQIHRGASEITNYINKTQVRLKDIQDLVMDTGLGRDSLSIITQGSISSFADAKPEERRTLFEEAAGVAKYKKRKKVSLAKLENVRADLERLQDLADSYKEQVDSLSLQAARAKEYIEARDRLAGIEIALLAVRITALKKDVQKILEDYAHLQKESLDDENRIDELERSVEELSAQMAEFDVQISQAQQETARVLQESASLQKQKAVLDERRKMDLDGSDAQKKKQSLLELFEEARFEYSDRRDRLAADSLELESLIRQEQKQTAARNSLAERKERLMQEIGQISNQLAGIESRIAHPPGRSQGASAILSRRNSLPGIHGLVKDLLHCEDRFLMAVSAALASAGDQIVVSSEKDARTAISYLKSSKAGKATFLPLTVCKERHLALWQQQKIENASGILGTAADFVTCEEKYQALKGRLLGTILIAADLESANDAARKLSQSLKIVTLEGDVVHAGGAMSGGYNRQTNHMASLLQEKDQLKRRLESLKDSLQETARRMESAEKICSDLTNRRIQKQIDKEKLANIVQVKKEKYDSLQSQIAQLDLSGREKNDSELVARLSALHQKQDELQSSLSLFSKSKAELGERVSNVQSELRVLRRKLSADRSTLSSLEVSRARMETRLEQDLMRLGSEYSLTYEAALARSEGMEFDPSKAESEVRNLRKKLSSMGNVNLEAPEQLEQIKEKYEFLNGQMQELEDASKQILEAVSEMDAVMVEKFKTMFEKINESLDEVFRAMFGGGHCRLVLCQPENLLETGIDVDVQPPGKAVKNLQTFSGGEKALIAISVLFAILKARTVPLCIFDEVEAALDQANVERFARYLSNFKESSQFITVTHRPGTMEQCDTLYGITMQQDGVSQVLKVLLKDAREMSRQV